ncbi:MAG: hypothetical protein U0T82_17240 [Bacteroidales bacterium]
MPLHAKSTRESLSYLSALLDKHKMVYSTRYGDGEILNMIGEDAQNHRASGPLLEELRQTFILDHALYLKGVAINYPLEPGMVHGLFAPHKDNSRLEKALTDNFGFAENFAFENPVLFQYLTVFDPGEMIKFLDTYIRPKRKMFIGSTPQPVAEKIYGKIDYYINIPAKSAYYTINEWYPLIAKDADKVDVVLPSAGTASNIIAYRLWQAGVQVHLLDIGSIVDAAEGKPSRKWIRLMGHRVNNILLPEARNRSLKFRINYLYKEIRFFLRLLVKGKKYNLPYQ